MAKVESKILERGGDFNERLYVIPNENIKNTAHYITKIYLTNA